MAKIQYIKDKENVTVYPVTHERAVRDSNNVTLETKLGQKQETLVSGTNIKTINNESILGSGNITAGDPNAVKYTSQTLTGAQKTQARTNIGAGTSSFSGSYNDLTNKPDIQLESDKVNSITGYESNTTKYPSTKALYDAIHDLSGPSIIQGVNATVSNTTGTPSVTATYSNSQLSFAFSNIKGETGAAGTNGTDGVDGVTPNITVGTVTTGAPGSQASASITGTAAAPVLNLTIPQGQRGEQGLQGNTGSSVDYAYELVNNRTTDDATKGLSAAEGKRLGDDLDQLEDKFDDVVIGMGRLIVSLFKKSAFLSNDAETDVNALESLLSGGISRIEAVYTQSGTIYVGQSLDDLKPDLVVTAYYLDGTSNIVTAYTLIGTLTAGTSTITISFGGKTTTFTASVTDAVYYRDGSKMIRPYFLNSNNQNLGPATVDGVTLVYTRSKSTSNVLQISRACYPYFDLDLVKGTDYQWIVKLRGLPAGSKVNVSLQYHNQAFKTDGLANRFASHAADIMDSGWLSSTISNGTLSFTYGSETASSALSLVGARLNLRLLDSSDNDIAWPDGSSIDALIIQTV